MSGNKNEKKIEEAKNVSVEAFVRALYEQKFTNDELKEIWESFKYDGFDRLDVLKSLRDVVKDVKVARELVILCSLKGPNKAVDTKLVSNGMTPRQMGIPASGQQRTKRLSCARISASTADLAAFYLKQMPNLPKKVMVECPAWLQFPSAAAIKMPEKYRAMHKEFSILFSDRINLDGKHPFNEVLYETIVANSYLDADLKLFEM